jgi:O-antigen ligase
MDRERLDHWCERGILGLVLAILVYGPLALGAVLPADFLVLQVLTMGVILLWLVRLWFGANPRLLWPPICWAVVAFAGYGVMRYTQADIEYLARREMIRILVYAVLFLAIVNHLHHQESVRIVALVLLGLGVLVSLYAIYQFSTNSPYVWSYVKPAQYAHRGSGTYICPNHLAGFLEMLVPLGLASALLGRAHYSLRIFFGYAALVILAGIGVTLSRGSWLATGLTLVLFAALLVTRRSYRLPAIGLVVIVLGAGVVFVRQNYLSQERLSNIAATAQTENNRFRLWPAAIQIWEDNLWLGAGPDHFDYRFRQHRPPNVQMRPERAHNDYLDALAEWGLVGSALVLSAWVLLFLGILKTWKYVRRNASDLGSRRGTKSAFVLGAALGLLALLLHSFVDFNFHIPANAILAVALMGLLASHLRFATDRYWVSRSLWVRLVVSVASIAALGYLGQQGLRFYQENRWLERAGKAAGFEARLAALKEAYAVDNQNFRTTYEIGEALRLRSWEGNRDFRDLAEQALPWFERTMKLNRWDVYGYARYGMCLDWLRRCAEATPYFKRAEEVDPNSYYMVSLQGWHLIQLGGQAENCGDNAAAVQFYTAALPLLRRSLDLHANGFAWSYREIVQRKLAELSASK